MWGRGILLGAAVTILCVCFAPYAEADLGEFGPNPVWPLCGRITENPPAQWVETDGCPQERWGNPAFTDTPISSTYGPRQLVSEGYRYDFHRGLDIATQLGTPVYAFADGIVKKAGPDPSYTDPLVQLRHYRPGHWGSCTNGGGCYHTNYLHMSDWTVDISDVVTKGDLIGYSGESAAGFEHVHFEIRDAPPQDSFSNWSRDAVHPLGVLPYNDSGAANYQLTLDSVDTADPLNPEVYVTLTIPLSVELDLDGFEAQVFEHQPGGSLLAIAQPGDTAFGNTIEGTGYLVEPSWYSMETWNRMYSYKNSTSVPWSAFGQGGDYESPYWAILPATYNANVHMDAQDPNDFQVGLFNGWSWQPSHTNANSAEYLVTVGLLSLAGTASADDLCIQVRALDVHGNGTEWVQYNCFLAIAFTEALDAQSVRVEFTGPLDQTSAENAVNYAIDQGVTVNSAALQGDGRSVVLSTSPLISGLTYLLTVNNVFDLQGHAIAADSQDSFTYLETVTAPFQDGVSPSAGYSGTRDTYVSGDEPGSNYGSLDELVLDDSERSLLYWDVSSIPQTAMVQSGSITIDVTNSGGDYQIYEVFQPWVENEATWNDYDNGMSWEVAGADGGGDRGSTVLGSVDTGSTGPLTVQLNADGVAAVQGWIEGTWPNYGFLLADASSTNGLDFVSREHGTASQRPLLSIDYTNICEQTFDWTAGEWKQISLACDPGTATQVSQVFGAYLAGTHEQDWIVFEREYNDTTGDQYQSVGWGEPMEVGRGYWIKTLQADQSVTVRGLYNVPVEVDLEGDAGGRYNLMGYPFEFDVCWADVEVINPAATPQQCANTPTCTLGEADAAGFISRIAHKWASGNYAAFDGQTPGLKGTLAPWDGFWVEAFAEGIKLKIPANPAGDCEALAETVSQAGAFRKSKNKKETANWFVRLIAESGDLADPYNVLGQLSDSVQDYDPHDLKELSPFGSSYLSIVFPHLEWEEKSGDYTSDFHSVQSKIKDEWYFEVVSSDPGATVTLRWEGQESLLEKAFLVDAETGKRYRVKRHDSYIFTMHGSRQGFWWLATR